MEILTSLYRTTMGLNSLKIVINLYKKGKITEEEAVQLIQDLQEKRNTYWYPWYYNTPYCKDETTITTTTTSGNENAIYTSSEKGDWKGIYWTCDI